MVYPNPDRFKMSRVPFDRTLSKSYWTWRRNLALMVPTLLSSSISVLVQSVFVIFGTALLLELESNGIIGEISSALSNGNQGALYLIISSPAFLRLAALYLGSAFAISAVFSVLAGGFALSAEYNSYAKALGGEPMGITGVMSTLKSKWKKMAWTQFLVYFFTYLPVGLALIFGLISIFSSGLGLFSFFTLIGLLGLGLIISALVSFLLMYSLILVAVDDVSGFSALSKSYEIAKNNFGVSFTYAIVRVLSYALITGIANLTSGVGLPLSSLASVAVTLLLVPVLHMTKTQIYLQVKSPEDMEFQMYGPTSATRDLFSSFIRVALTKLRQGVVELKDYALNYRNIPYHIASTLSLALGVLIGAFIATHGLDSAILSLGYVEGQINPTILGDIPLSAGFDIFLHNWLVSVSTALSGMWLVAPSLVTLGFNGMILGVVYYLTPNFTMFAAAIFPHGSIEIPSFVIAGSAGMRLGVSFIRSLGKSPDSFEEGRFYLITRQTVYVVIGLAVLFLIAGAIEGNITPIIMRMYGWR